MELFIIRQVIKMSKIVILSFSEGEEEVCQRILQILSESTRFEGCNELQVEKNISIGEMKLNLLEKNVIIHGTEVMLTNREFEILYLLAQGSVFNFVSMAFYLIPEAGCGQSPQSLVNTGDSGNSLY